MKNIINTLVAFVRDEQGLTAVEYAIAGGLVGGGVIGAFTLLGDGTFNVIDALQNALNSIDMSGAGGAAAP